MKRIFVAFWIVILLFFAGSLSFAAVVDVVEYPTGFFVDNDFNKYNSPYYRWHGEDWGWQHSAIAGTWSTATLSISAFDVDNYDEGSYWEKDHVYGWRDGAWNFIGELEGASDIWSYTTFNLGSEWFDSIASGLLINFVIDVNNQGWAVTLAKSVLSLDGGQLPDPEPNPTPAVPEPSTALLLGAGFLGMAYLRRKRV